MSTSDDPLAGRAPVLTQALLLSVLVAVAAYLRLRYAQDIHLYVDEFGTLLAVRSILERGLPILPSGTFYSHGLLFSYLDALFVSLLRFGETVARLPSVFIGALTVPLVYLAGKRLFSSGVGWIAAGALAVDPEAIVWGGRARMYSLLQALILLATVFLVLGAIVGDRVRYRVLGAICIVAAIFTHPEAALFVLPVVMAVLLLRGPRWILKADVILEAILISLALVGVYLMNKWGQAGLLETMGAERPFVALTSTELRGLQVFGPFLADSYRLPWSLFSLAGLGILLWGTFRRRSLAGMGDADRSLLTLYILFGVVMVILVFLVGDTWQEPRYAFMMLPLLFLTAGEFLVRAGRWLGSRVRVVRLVPAWAFVALFTLALTLFTFLMGMEKAFAQELGYDQVFRHVRARWQEGDVIVTISPAASMLYLDRCDYFAIQRGYSEYLMRRDGAWVDRWAGATPLTEVSQLTRVLKESPRTWFVVDGWRLQTRYDVDFVAEVVGRMELDFGEEGAFAFLAEGYADRAPPQIHRELDVNFGGEMRLVSYDLSSDHLAPGEELGVALKWQALETRDNYKVFVYVVGQDGRRLAQRDSHVLGGFYNPALWEHGDSAVDHHRLIIPSDASPGVYRVEVGIYRPLTLERVPVLSPEGMPVGDSIILDYVSIGQVEAEDRPGVRVGARLGEQVELMGYDVVLGVVEGVEPILSLEPGAPLGLRVYWQALSPPLADYTVFLHLVDEHGRIAAQWDAQPMGGFAPTSSWRPGRTFVDPVEISMDSIPPGSYVLYAGMYALETGERLLTEGGGDRIKLANVRVGPDD